MENKVYRVMGKRGRTTVPLEIRRVLGLGYNDIVSFVVADGAVRMQREKLCDNCHSSLEQFLDGLTSAEQREALIYLSVKWAGSQTGGEP